MGQVLDSVEKNRQAAWYNQDRAMVLAIQRQPGTNTIEVVDAVRKLLPTFKALLPADILLEVRYDRSISIRESVEDVKFTLVLAIALVVMVVFLFLRNISATIITSLAVPTSIIGTFMVMYFMGFSLDNLSLMALTLSVGFVVDDAIVMLENIVRHIEQGETVMQAALSGSREIGFTVISMTISLVAVFIPVLFMGGLLGRLLNEFAVTISVAILVSGFVSLTLTPMLCSRFLRSSAQEDHGRLYLLSEKIFDAGLHLYELMLKGVLAHRFLSMLLLLALTVVMGYLFVVMPKGFIPSQDMGHLIISTEAAQGISYESMVRHQQELARLIIADKRVEGCMSFVGVGGPNLTGNAGLFSLNLVPRKERKEDVFAMAHEMRSKLNHLPGIQVFPQVRSAHTHRRAEDQEPVSVHPAEPR